MDCTYLNKKCTAIVPTKATNQTEGDSGMGSLGRNIEFMFLKVAELETIVELQQAQIMSLTDRLNAVENKTGLVQKDWGNFPGTDFLGLGETLGGWTRLDVFGSLVLLFVQQMDHLLPRRKRCWPKYQNRFSEVATPKKILEYFATIFVGFCFSLSLSFFLGFSKECFLAFSIRPAMLSPLQEVPKESIHHPQHPEKVQKLVTAKPNPVKPGVPI